MTSKIISGIIFLFFLLLCLELLIPNHVQKSVIKNKSFEHGSVFSPSSGLSTSRRETWIYFSELKTPLIDDAREFNEGDSIEYELSPIVGNLISIKNIATGYSTVSYSYSTLTVLLLICGIVQIINLKVRFEKDRKEFVDVIIFSLLFICLYILIFK